MEYTVWVGESLGKYHLYLSSSFSFLCICLWWLLWLVSRPVGLPLNGVVIGHSSQALPRLSFNMAMCHYGCHSGYTLMSSIASLCFLLHASKATICWWRGLLEPFCALQGDQVCCALTGSAGLVGQAPMTVDCLKITVWERCWCFITLENSLHQKLSVEGWGRSLYVLLCDLPSLHTDIVSCGFRMGKLERLKEKRNLFEPMYLSVF